ncbi:MAG: serine hydrolase domain-containing protein [Lapillicoccus sp.]
MTEPLPRRAVLRGLTASAVAAASASWVTGAASAAPAAAKPSPPATDWSDFGRKVASAFETLHNVGGAVAVVSADRVLHLATFGVRNLQGRRPVTPSTVFRVGSTTKSMAAALVATYVDDGSIGWDQKVVDAWPRFRAPTDEMTRTLRVRDLLGMGSGIGEPAPVESGLHFDGLTAAQIVESAVTFPVVAPRVDDTFYYANSIQSVGGYLPLLATGVAPGDLASAWAVAVRERVFEPAGMAGARILGDPRGQVEDYATGNALDLGGRATSVPFAPMGAYAPSGGAMVSITDMARWLQLQLRQGSSVTGHQVVSAKNLAECYVPHVTVPPAASLPGALSMRYAMGWNDIRYAGGTRLVGHGGAIDGFNTFMAFFPDHDLGLVVSTSLNTMVTGDLWPFYSLSLMLSQQFGINPAGPQQVLDMNTTRLATLAGLARQARPVDLKRTQPYLGYYEGGWSVARQGRELQLRIGPRVFGLQVMPDGSYVVSSGSGTTIPLKLAMEADGTPHIEIPGVETVRRTTGL